MKITMFEAADGTLFKKEKEQIAHDVKLRVQPAMETFVGNLPESDDASSQFYCDERGEIVIAREDLAALLTEHHAELVAAITSATVKSRRGRKPGSKNKVVAAEQMTAQ